MTCTRSTAARLLSSLTIAVAALGAAPAPAAAQVAKPTDLKYPPLPTFQVPKPTRFVLPNGLVVMVIEDHELPLVNVSARIRTGSLLEPADKTGLAGLVGQVLRTGGTTTRKPGAKRPTARIRRCRRRHRVGFRPSTLRLRKVGATRNRAWRAGLPSMRSRKSWIIRVGFMFCPTAMYWWRKPMRPNDPTTPKDFGAG